MGVCDNKNRTLDTDAVSPRQVSKYATARAHERGKSLGCHGVVYKCII